MENDVKNFLSDIKKNHNNELTREGLITEVVINIERIVIELHEIKKITLETGHEDTFSIVILGSQMEKVKRDLIKIKQEYQKK